MKGVTRKAFYTYNMVNKEFNTDHVKLWYGEGKLDRFQLDERQISYLTNVLSGAKTGRNNLKGMLIKPYNLEHSVPLMVTLGDLIDMEKGMMAEIQEQIMKIVRGE